MIAYNSKRLVSINNPIYIGLLLLTFCTIYNTSHYGATLSWVLIPSIIIIIGGLISIKRLKFKGDVLIIYLFWIVYLFSTLLSSYVSTQRDIVTFFVFCTVLVISASKEYSEQEIHFLITFYILVSFTCEVNMMTNFLTGNYYNSWFRRISFSFLGIYKDPNYAMAFISPALLWSFIRLLNKRYRYRIVYLVILLLGIACSLLSGSRSAILSLGISIVTFFLFNKSTKSNKRVTTFLLILLISMIGYWVIVTFLPSQSVNRLLSAKDDSRLEIWRYAIQVFKERPIFGGGMNAANSRTKMVLNIDSHNVYIDILAGSGIVGALIFLIFLRKNCVSCYKDDSCIVISSMIVFMLPMFFINGFNTATFYLPLIILSIFSYYSRRNENLIEII